MHFVLVSFFLLGIFLVATPGYVISKSSYPVPGGIGGDIFCRLLDNRYLLFGMGKVSILLVACLAIERWYCVLKPTQYRQQFSRKRIIIYVFVSFIITCILSMNKFFENSLAGNKCASQKAPHGSNWTRAFVFAWLVLLNSWIVKFKATSKWLTSKVPFFSVGCTLMSPTRLCLTECHSISSL